MQSQRGSSKTHPLDFPKAYLRGEQVKLCFKHSRLAMITTAVNSAILAAILWPELPSQRLVIWLAVNLVIVGARYFLLWKYKRRSSDYENAQTWGHLFTFGLMLSGVAFGSAGIFLYPPQSIAHQVFLAFMMGGMTAGAVGAYSALRGNFIFYTIPVITPIFIRLISQGSTIPTLMGALILFFWFMMLTTANSIHGNIKRSLELSLQNISLSSKLLQAQEVERKHIAQELHDSTISNLSAIKYLLESKSSAGALCDDKCPVPLDKITRSLSDVIKDLRRLMSNLRPSTLDDLGLIPTLQWLTRDMQSYFPQFKIAADIGVEESEVPEHLKVIIFRVIQEALTNAVKYSRGDFISVQLNKGISAFYLIIKDNGIGLDLHQIDFDLAEKTKMGSGMGLNNMRDRVELTGGKFRIKSAPGKGTAISAEWPLEVKI